LVTFQVYKLKSEGIIYIPSFIIELLIHNNLAQMTSWCI